MPSPEQALPRPGWTATLQRNREDWEYTVRDPDGVRVAGGFTFDGPDGPAESRARAIAEARHVARTVIAAEATPYRVGAIEQVEL